MDLAGFGWSGSRLLGVGTQEGENSRNLVLYFMHLCALHRFTRLCSGSPIHQGTGRGEGWDGSLRGDFGGVACRKGLVKREEGTRGRIPGGEDRVGIRMGALSRESFDENRPSP